MKVTFFHRRNGPSRSIEILFETIRQYLPSDIVPYIFISKYQSKGVLPRLYNIIEAVFHQSDVNHVTGDVHFLTFLLSKKRTILTIHDCTLVFHSRGIKRLLLIFFWYYLPVKRVKYITVISDKTKQDLLSLVSFPEERIMLIPNCISDNFQYNKKVKFNTDKPLILAIGTTFNKNLHTLCQALKGFSCTLDIVGKISDEQKSILEENNIDYINSFDLSMHQLIEKYLQADLLSFVSTYEGFGVPILEAQAIGTPVVTSNISPMKEVAGNGACLVDPYNPNSIFGGIKKVCDDKYYRETLINNGLENVKRYRSINIANEYADLYRKVYVGLNGSD